MGTASCTVCDECGKHAPDEGANARLGRPARPPKGWVGIILDEALEVPLLCSEECLLKYNAHTGYVAVMP